MFKFITQRSFFVNLLVAIALILVIFFMFFISLGYITRHDEVIKVPAATGRSLTDATSFLKKQGFEVSVQDSVYVDSLAPLTVVKQSPESDETVKTGRTIYLTVNRAQPPLIEMPDLRGYSFRSAQMYLQSLGLKLGDTSYTPDIARNAVKDQKSNGKTIEPGTKVLMGTAIDFVLGNGLGETELTVPDLVGFTVSQAKDYLAGDKINIGVMIALSAVQDTANAYIVKQNPEPETILPDGGTTKNHIRAGQLMDIWISATPPVRDSTNTQSPPTNQ